MQRTWWCPATLRSFLPTSSEVAPLMRMERTATVTAMTTCVVASCDRETFTELLRPLYVSD